MKHLKKFNESKVNENFQSNNIANLSVNEDIYSLIDQLSNISTLIEDDLIDFKDQGYSLYEDGDGDIILKGKHKDIYQNIKILNKLKGLNVKLIDVKLSDSKFKYVISNSNRVDISKKIMEYFLKNLKFVKITNGIRFTLSLKGGDGIEIDIRNNLSVFIDSGYDFMGSDIYQKSGFEYDDTFDKIPNKKEWESLINLVKDCIDYAKKNNIKI